MLNPSNPTIAVLLTCFNRLQKTLKCLQVVFSQSLSDNLNLTVLLVDDGSTDGTADAVRQAYPKVQILTGDGNLFWNGGMHLAFGKALEEGYDYYLWLNDDTYFHDGAIRKLLDLHLELTDKGKEESILIGVSKDPISGSFSYGGYRRTSSLNPIGLTLIPPTEDIQLCDTFCGNFVLIPKQVTNKVGNIDPSYKHRWGDVDYGLRARKLGCLLWVTPGLLADCEDNPMADRWRDPTLSVRERIQNLHSIRGLGKEDWPKFTLRHGGIFWPFIWARPYLRIIRDTFTYTPKQFISRLLNRCRDE